MKTHKLTLAFLFSLVATLTSCSVVGGIFKTGVGVGVFLVIFVIGIIIYLVSRAGGK